MEGCLGVNVRRFSLLSQGLRHHRVLALDHVPSSTTMPSSALGELIPARPVTPSPCASRSGNSTAQRRGSTPSSPKAFAKLGQLRPTTIFAFGRLAVRICAEPSTASCSWGRCRISTRRSVGYDTMRSQTHATLGRLQVAQVESDTIGDGLYAAWSGRAYAHLRYEHAAHFSAFARKIHATYECAQISRCLELFAAFKGHD